MFDEIPGGGAGGAAVAAPPAAIPPAVPAASPAAASDAASAAASPESPNIKQLREQYESTKGKLEPWEKAFKDTKVDDVVAAHQTFSSMNREALELGEKLGYDKAEVAEFMRKDPVAVLQHLRQKASASEPQTLTPADARKLVEKAVAEGLKPYEQKELNQRVEQATTKFNGEFDRLFKENYKDGLPDEAREALYEMVNQMCGDDPEACKALMSGQVSHVQKHFAAGNARIQKIFTAMLGHERKRLGQEPDVKPGDKPKPADWGSRKLSTGQSLKELFNN